jgi:DNA transformation protein
MAQDDLRDHCVELLASLGPVRWRRMFGGIGIYVDDLFIAIIASDRLYLKAGPQFRPQFEAAGCEPFVYSARTGAVALGYWSAPPDAMESPALMQPWARLAMQSALAARNAAVVKPKAASARPRARRKPAS